MLSSRRVVVFSTAVTLAFSLRAGIPLSPRKIALLTQRKVICTVPSRGRRVRAGRRALWGSVLGGVLSPCKEVALFLQFQIEGGVLFPHSISALSPRGLVVPIPRGDFHHNHVPYDQM